MSAALILFDDARARRWSPFAETRPVGELRYGAMLLRERVERVAGVPCALHLAGPALAGWDEPGAPRCGLADEVGRDRARIYWSSRAVPDGEAARAALAGGDPATLRIGGTIVGWRVPPGEPGPDAGALSDPDAHASGPDVSVAGEILGWPWTLVERNADRLAADLQALHARDDIGPLPGVVRRGSGLVSLGSGAEIEPGIVVDARGGPVRLDDEVRVEGPARLVGPLHLGRGTQVFGGSLGRLAAGPVCKLRGEVDSAVFLGWANKAHDGYLGHALVGRWVNLGALTTNSDLKNSYSSVRVELPRGTEDTGLMKVGSFLGDHVKTGIGTLLTTGAVIGAGSNVFGGGTVPRHVPAFSWGGADGLVPYRFDKFVPVAEAAMARRDEELTPGVRRVLEEAWRTAQGGRP